MILDKKDEFNSSLSLGRMSLCFLQPIFLLPSTCSTRLMSSLIKRHGWQMVGLKTLETSSLNELFHQVWAGTHVGHTPNRSEKANIRLLCVSKCDLCLAKCIVNSLK